MEVIFFSFPFLVTQCNRVENYFCKHKGNILLVITFLFVDGMISNFGNNE